MRPSLRPLLLLMLLFVGTGCPDSRTSDHGCEEQGCAVNERCNPVTLACERLPSCDAASTCADGEECLAGVCSSCQSNIQCTGALGTCDTRSLECVGCESDARCGADAPHCGSSGACLECIQDAHCPGGKCFRGWCGTCADSARLLR